MHRDATDRAPHPPTVDSDTLPTAETTAATGAVVAVCQGHRCRALLAAREPEGMSALRRAARCSHRGVLLTTDCTGLCALGPVIAVGTGRHADGTVTVTTRAVLGPVTHEHLPALDRYLQEGDGAEDLPPELLAVSLAPAGLR